MYTHITKGFTIGQTLTRRILRTIIGIPGAIIDAGVAVLYPSESGQYADYWNECGLKYADGSNVNGVCRGVTGYVGDIAGAAIGGIVGSVVGGVCYIPDALGRTVCWVHDKVHDGFDKVANAIGNREFFKNLPVIRQPVYYLEKAWNVSVGTLGVAIASPFYAVSKAIEYFIPPLKTKLSDSALKVGGIVGGVIGTVASAIAWPVKHICNKAVSLFRSFRDKVRSAAAFVYAKTNENPSNDARSCIPPESVHSTEFRERVTRYKNSTTAELLCGPLRAPDLHEPLMNNNQQAAAQANDEPWLDPILLQPLEDPVIDPHGHTFSRSSISRWIREHHDCPVNRQALREDQLIPNRIAEDLVRMRIA